MSTRNIRPFLRAALCFFVIFLLSNPSSGQPPPHSIDKPLLLTSDEESAPTLLRKNNCTCSTEVGGYLCQGAILDQFAKYEWTHPRIEEFARQFIQLYHRLAQTQKTMILALQGEADALTISKFKKWKFVDENFGRRQGRTDNDVITNQDLAWLRSVAVFRALRNSLPSGQTIKYLEPIAHTSGEGGKFRATKVYIVGYQEGCADAR